MTEEQKGCYRHSKGCKEQVIIDSIITQQAVKGNRNLSVAYIDYQKAFDSVPHSYLIEILQMYKIDTLLIQFLQEIMKKWTTVLQLTTPRQS